MASFSKLSNGKVRAFVEVNGYRASKVLPARQAKSWARGKEEEFLARDGNSDPTKTLADLFARYAEEVSPTKKGVKWERIRLGLLSRDGELSSVHLVDLRREHLEAWRDRRLKKVMGSTVNRELNLISHCLTKARVWRWMKGNPLEDFERPKNPKHRSRRISEEEILKICMSLGYREGQKPTTKSHFAALAFLFAIETAMRAGEICGLKRPQIHLDHQVANLCDSKNGFPRDIPLSDKAIAILKLLPNAKNNRIPLFQLKNSETLSSLFRKHAKNAGVEDIVFHDSRHEAITRLANLPGMNVLRLASITGHRDIRFLMVYFNESARDMVSVINDSKGTSKAPEGLESPELIKMLAKELLEQTSNLNENMACHR